MVGALSKFEHARRDRRAAWLLVASAAVMLLGAGFALWARYGDFLFANYLLTALAGCF